MYDLDTWINEPIIKMIDDNKITFQVLANTDFWQVTHYGFSRTDGNCLVKEIAGDISFTVKVTMNYISEFDQCGIIVYYDQENFAKLCVENQLKTQNKLGSVVCKNKRSDWATQPFTDYREIYFRISKRGINYLFESSLDGKEYTQMRLFDMPVTKNPKIGVFGASPLGQGFQAEFTEFKFQENSWYLDKDDLPQEVTDNNEQLIKEFEDLINIEPSKLRKVLTSNTKKLSTALLGASPKLTIFLKEQLKETNLNKEINEKEKLPINLIEEAQLKIIELFNKQKD